MVTFGSDGFVKVTIGSLFCGCMRQQIVWNCTMRLNAMRTSSHRMAILMGISALLLSFHSSVASAATVTITVGNNCFCFSPSSVTIHPGDTVQWTWSSTGHSSTSGSPGMPTGLWDSGILNQGAVFTRTFNTVGSFPYYCTPHGACCNMVGTVIVSAPTPSPTATPTATPAVSSWLGNISTRGFVQTADNVMIGGFIVQGTQPKTV